MQVLLKVNSRSNDKFEPEQWAKEAMGAYVSYLHQQKYFLTIKVYVINYLIRGLNLYAYSFVWIPKYYIALFDILYFFFPKSYFSHII